MLTQHEMLYRERERNSPWPHTTQRIKKRTTTRASREDKWIDVNCSSSTAAPCEEGAREREKPFL